MSLNFENGFYFTTIQVASFALDSTNNNLLPSSRKIFNNQSPIFDRGHRKASKEPVGSIFVTAGTNQYQYLQGKYITLHFFSLDVENRFHWANVEVSAGLFFS